MSTIIITGFPGFLGSALLERLIPRYPAGDQFLCLIQAKFRPLAEQRLAEIVARVPAGAGRILLVDGDITVPDLGLGERYASWQQTTSEIYHLAAVYDLGVGRSLAMRVNVDGTRHMLAFAEGCPGLQRFQYVSTCFVSGRHPGVFSVIDLSVSQSFNNFYEETKFLAELAVQQKMAAGLPVTIYRPSIVVGNSQSGATQKYDGPYYYIRWLLVQPPIALMPAGRGAAHIEFNVVPSDYVVDSLVYLSGLPKALGQVYHLSDPEPMTMMAMGKLLGQLTGRHPVWVPIPVAVTKGVLRATRLYRWLHVEPESVNYVRHPTRYSCDNTLRDLAGSGITCPPFASYAPHMVEFVRSHPEITAAAMV